jgi:hypothetical protein
MSEKQAKRKRRQSRKQRAALTGNGGQTSLWQMDPAEQLAAGATGTAPGEGNAPTHTNTAPLARPNGSAVFGPLAIALFGDLARALAAVCFVVPGGFPDLFGERYDAVEILGGWIGEAAARAYCQEITERYCADLPQVTATFTVGGSETESEALTCDVTLWFDMARDEEILRLHAEDYRSTQQGDGGVAARIVTWAADRNAPLAALCQRASTAGQAIICRVDAGQADYYCYVHRRKLLTRTAERT